jgi:hypothetical protein
LSDKFRAKFGATNAQISKNPATGGVFLLHSVANLLTTAEKLLIAVLRQGQNISPLTNTSDIHPE